MRPGVLAFLCAALTVSPACGGSGAGGDPDSGGDDAGIDSNGGDGGSPAPEPRFAGITLAYSPGPTEVSVHWAAAEDDATAADQIVYELFQGADRDAALAAAIDGGSPVATTTGETFAVVGGLAAGQTYYFAAVARDGDGNRSEIARPVAATTIPEEWSVKQVPIDLADLDVTVEESGLNAFTVIGPDAGDLAPGDLVIIPNSYGRSLKRVVAAKPVGADVALETASATLSDVIATGTLSATASLVDLGGTADERRLSFRAPTAPPAVRRYEDPAGFFATRQETFPAPLDEGALRSAGEVDFNQDVQMTYTAEFVPELRATARWDEAGGVELPEYFRATASGSFTFTATLSYDANASAEYKVDKELFSRSFTFRYLIAGVPVIQEVELKFMAELDFKAETPIKMTKQFSATKEVVYGFEWSRAAGFTPIREDGFMKTDDFSLEGEATAKATIKVYPTISTTFYQAARAKLTLEANVEVDAKATLLPPPPEITKFDAKLWVDVWADANLTILGREIDSWTSDKYTILEVPLHSMPELSLDYRGPQLDTCGTRQIYLRLANGYNNDVSPPSIEWSVQPPGPVLTVAPGGLQAAFSSTTAGDYTIEVSGHGDGFLGALGTRRASKAISVVDAPPGDCDPANSEPVGAEGVFGCGLDIPYGVTTSPMPTRTMIAPGDELGISVPAYCPPDACYYQYALAQFDYNQPVASNLSHTMSEMQPAFDGIDGDWGIAPTATDLNMTGGPYALNVTIASGTASQNVQYSNYGAEANNVSPTNYGVAQHDGQTAECYEISALPVHVVHVVAPRLGDGHDDPTGGFVLPINEGFRVSQHTRYQDDDWYQVTPTSEGGRGVPYDTEAPYDPGCLIRIEVADSYYTELEVYGSLADAETRTGVLATGNPVVIRGIEGVTFYARAVGPDYTNVDYTIQAISDCDETFVGAYPALTAPPSASATTIDNNGSTIDLALAFTSNTDWVQIGWRAVDGTLGAGGASQMGLAGSTSLTLPVNAQFSPVGEFIAVITMYDEEIQERSTYLYDPTFSTTHYTIERTNQSDVTYREVTTYPLLLVNVIE